MGTEICSASQRVKKKDILGHLSVVVYMKIVAVVTSLDLRFRLGGTPAYLQLLKALYETGNEIIVIPYLGRPYESLWWQVRPNPWRHPGEVYHTLSKKFLQKKSGGNYNFREGMVHTLTTILTRPIWMKYLLKVAQAEGDIDALLFLGPPVNQIQGISREIKRKFNIKAAFFEGDMPAILPEYNVERGFMFDSYKAADLSEFDLFLVNSEGVIQTLRERGARNVKALHYAADPELYCPIELPKKWDVSFFGYGNQTREKWMTKMITEPSEEMSKVFAVGGSGFAIPLGKADIIGDVPISGFRRFCCSSRINLNITRESHTRVYASSTARPFELAALGCCMVSCPYNGIENWFVPGKEIVVLSENESPRDIYSSLLDDEESLRTIGEAARRRVLLDHTYRKRATDIIRSIKEAHD